MNCIRLLHERAKQRRILRYQFDFRMTIAVSHQKFADAAGALSHSGTDESAGSAAENAALTHWTAIAEAMLAYLAAGRGEPLCDR